MEGSSSSIGDYPLSMNQAQQVNSAAQGASSPPTLYRPSYRKNEVDHQQAGSSSQPASSSSGERAYFLPYASQGGESCIPPSTCSREPVYDEKGFRLRAGCFPLRLSPEGRALELLLVTSSKDKSRWTIPAGPIQFGEIAAETSCRETRSKAGVSGRLRDPERPVGVWLHPDGKTKTSLFLLDVLPEYEKEWEQADRERKWFSLSDAEQALQWKPLLHRMFLALKHRLGLFSSAPSSSTGGGMDELTLLHPPHHHQDTESMLSGTTSNNTKATTNYQHLSPSSSPSPSSTTTSSAGVSTTPFHVTMPAHSSSSSSASTSGEGLNALVESAAGLEEGNGSRRSTIALVRKGARTAPSTETVSSSSATGHKRKAAEQDDEDAERELGGEEERRLAGGEEGETSLSDAPSGGRKTRARTLQHQ
ncbi:hypothetical protein QOT17_013394 [Balamuthia mandrillaris]